MALRPSKYEEEIPQIGKIKDMDDLNVTIEWWIGSYGGTWICWRKERGEPVFETFPRNAVLCKIHLTKSMRLTSNEKSQLNLYEAKNSYRYKILHLF